MGAVTFSCLLPLIDATKSNLNLSEGQGDAIASLSSVRVVVGDRGVSADSERNHRLFIGGISGQIAATEGIDDVSCCSFWPAASSLYLFHISPEDGLVRPNRTTSTDKYIYGMIEAAT